MSRKAPFSELRQLVTKDMGVPAELQRFWKWAKRQNGTYRPALPLVVESEDQPILVRCAAGIVLALGAARCIALQCCNSAAGSDSTLTALP